MKCFVVILNARWYTMTHCLILWESQGCRAHRRQAVELCENERGDRTTSEKRERERENVRMDEECVNGLVNDDRMCS